jgi:hypothetical protein
MEPQMVNIVIRARASLAEKCVALPKVVALIAVVARLFVGMEQYKRVMGSSVSRDRRKSPPQAFAQVVLLPE